MLQPPDYFKCGIDENFKVHCWYSDMDDLPEQVLHEEYIERNWAEFLI